jgi:N-acetylglucosaminyl-diphospho-decaprenol L-rhamnosyltransferase
MGAGNNLGIKNVKKDFALILNPDVVLEKNSMNEIFIISKEIDDFAIIAPISDKKEYPNYILKKDHNFDSVKPFQVKSVDGFAMLLNLKKLNQFEIFRNHKYFDENIFMYLENDDLCKRLSDLGENIYIAPKSKIMHLGAKAVDDKYKNEIELSRNWHWLWSKFYYNKKHYGFFSALLNGLPSFISASIKFLLYSLILNKGKSKIYFNRILGFSNALIGKKSHYRPKLNNFNDLEN